MTRGALHHVELWIADLGAVAPSWDWLLAALGYSRTRSWVGGEAWTPAGGGADLVLEAGPDVRGDAHDRLRPGLNHLAFDAGSRADVDALVLDAPRNGWTLLFADRHPWAGGPGHYAAYLEDAGGFEVELVATT